MRIFTHYLSLVETTRKRDSSDKQTYFKQIDRYIAFLLTVATAHIHKEHITI